MYIDEQSGQPSSEPGAVGAGALLGLAAAGQVQVDQTTGEATIQALTQIQDRAVQMQRSVHRVAVKTPLGGGYGEAIGQFNQQLAVGGPNCAQDTLTRFIQEIGLLKEAVAKSMATYQATDSDGARRVTAAGDAQ